MENPKPREDRLERAVRVGTTGTRAEPSGAARRTGCPSRASWHMWHGTRMDPVGTCERDAVDRVGGPGAWRRNTGPHRERSAGRCARESPGTRVSRVLGHGCQVQGRVEVSRGVPRLLYWGSPSQRTLQGARWCLPLTDEEPEAPRAACPRSPGFRGDRAGAGPGLPAPKSLLPLPSPAWQLRPLHLLVTAPQGAHLVSPQGTQWL